MVLEETLLLSVVCCVKMLTISLLTLLLTGAAAQACILKVQVNDFPPYSYWQDGRWQGSRVVLAERLAAKLRCKTDYLDVAWGRALLLMQQGELDLMFNLTKTKEREAAMFFLSPHHTETLVLAVTADMAQWRFISSLNDLRTFPGSIAITQGSYLGAAFSAFAKDPMQAKKIVAVAHRKAKTELVLKGRAQAVVEDRDYLNYAISNFPAYQSLQVTPLIISETQVYAALSKKSQLGQRAGEFELAIAELIKEDLWSVDAQ